MVVVGCPAMMVGGMGPIHNFNFFFICGLPGGIDCESRLCLLADL